MHRARRKNIQEEDAAKLLFGDEFKDVQCLLISEVDVLLRLNRENKAKEHSNADKTISEIVEKTSDYCARFGKFTNKDTVKEVRQLFASSEYEQFETAQLSNLCCESAEEAKILIPSLANKDDVLLQNLLTEMQNLKKFQTTSS